MTNYVGTLLNRLVTQVFPIVLLGFAGTALFLQLSTPAPHDYEEVQFRAARADAIDATSVVDVAKALSGQGLVSSLETRLSTQPFWIRFDIDPATGGDAQVIELPSRHSSEVECWDAVSGRTLGYADRGRQTGLLQESRGGFAIQQLNGFEHTAFLCSVKSRGPARISVQNWSASEVAQANESFRQLTVLIEAGIGVLALFMLMTAVVNRSGLYLTFVGWLLLNMRMAALSAGTDTSYFGIDVPVASLLTSRQWVLCAYYTMTIGLFSALFKEELAGFKNIWPLRVHQVTALLYVAMCPFLAYEQMLPILWISTLTVVVVMVAYLLLILKRTNSRVAGWYAASIIITLVASLNEVISAATGNRILLQGLNSVTAAIASALLASAAVAEHMRTHRLQTIDAQKRLEAAYEDSPVGLFTLNSQLEIVKQNSAFLQLLKTTVDSMPKTLMALLGPQDFASFRANLVAGKPIDLQIEIANQETASTTWCILRASSEDGAIIECSLQDINERVQATERMAFLASHDPLTKCLNLRGLAETTNKSNVAPTALAYFDLDRFKLINDTYGHAAGDVMLQQVAERISGLLAPGEQLARVGGDEFVIVFYDRSLMEAAAVCHNVTALIQSPFNYRFQSFSLDVSGGLVGVSAREVDTFKESLNVAETLCRIAKKKSDRRLVVLDSSDSFYQQYKDELDLIACLEKGTTPSGLCFQFLPEVPPLATKPFLNLQVELKLKKPDGSYLGQSAIMEAAEAHGKTAIIDRWVANNVLDWVASHLTALQSVGCIGLSLAGGSINDESFTAEFFALLATNPSASRKLRVGLAESVVVADARNARKFVDQVRSYGCDVVMEQFGAGQASFGYLKQLNATAVKIDGGLAAEADTRAGSAMIRAIVEIAKSLNMTTIAEGVSAPALETALNAAGIEFIQGPVIAPAVSPDEIQRSSTYVKAMLDRKGAT